MNIKNLIVISILNTNKFFNFDQKFDEGSFEKEISLDKNSYIYFKLPSLGLQL